MAYELYQSKFKGSEIDSLLSDVVDIKDKCPTRTEVAAQIEASLTDIPDRTEVEEMIDEHVVDIPIATTEVAGIVKPDGETITINTNGLIKSTIVDNIVDVIPELNDDNSGKIFLYTGKTTSEMTNGCCYKYVCHEEETFTDDSELSYTNQLPAILWVDFNCDGTFYYKVYDEKNVLINNKSTVLLSSVDLYPGYKIIVTGVNPILKARKTFYKYKLDVKFADEYILPKATINLLGGVKPDGTTITVDSDGTIHGASSVDIATTSKAGIVKPDGTTITIDSDGTIHGSSSVDIATTSKAGIVKPDGTSISIDSNGLIKSTNNFMGIGYENYGTDEVCIGKWIDGKPLYRKIIKAQMPTVKTQGTTVDTDIPLPNNVTMNNVITCSIKNLLNTGTWMASVEGKWFDSTTSYFAGWVAGNYVKIRSASTSYNGLYCYILLEYTKTSDAANSFTPDMVYSGMIDSQTATDAEVTEVLA